MAFVSGLDRLVEAVEATEAAAAAKRPPRQVAGGFECPHPDCRRVFSKRYNQQAHMRLHDGTRPFACELCGKSFRWKSSLKSHAKMHAKTSAAELNKPPHAEKTRSKLTTSSTTKVVGGVSKRRSKSSSPSRKKTSIVRKHGVPLELPTMTSTLAEKHAAGRKSPDSISMVDHAAATMLTMLR